MFNSEVVMDTAKRTQRRTETPKSTQDKILFAATKVFAEHGYKNATTRMICTEARVNVALVNYYFRSKAELYKAVIAALFEDVAKPMLAIPEAVRDEATWRQAVRTWVRRSLSICAACKPPKSYVARLMGLEECVPSELAQDINGKFAVPMRRAFARLIRMALPDANPIEIALWASSVSSQSLVYALTKSNWAERFLPPNASVSDEEWLSQVADHICSGIFSRLSFRRFVE